MKKHVELFPNKTVLFFHGQHYCTCSVFRLPSHKRAAKYNTNGPTPYLSAAQWHSMKSADLGARKKKRKKKSGEHFMHACFFSELTLYIHFSTKISHISEFPILETKKLMLKDLPQIRFYELLSQRI